MTELSTAITVGEAHAILRRRLESGVEADHLLCHALGCDRAHLYAHPEAALGPARRRHLEKLLQKRLGGVPAAYLGGTREFFSLEFEVTPDVLIPRPETETLVEVALAAAPQRARILDLGTGCGAVAVALAAARPDVEVTACDNSRAALAVAERNARRHGVSVSVVESDWFERLAGEHFDLIACNPPYVAVGDPHLDPAVAAHEPGAAVFAPDGGLGCLRRVIGEAPARLRSRGVLALEHGYNQAEAVARLMQAAGFGDVRCTKDLARQARVTTGTGKEIQQ